MQRLLEDSQCVRRVLMGVDPLVMATGAHSMMFATVKARDAFEKWAMFKKRRASMSDTAVDVAKLRTLNFCPGQCVDKF
eukprot:m.1297739 g.1297739  ORF g.1297739 m.1297739 type:complete len:79 (-) comp24798_c1_seq30:393-629(-)